VSDEQEFIATIVIHEGLTIQMLSRSEGIIQDDPSTVDPTQQS